MAAVLTVVVAVTLPVVLAAAATGAMFQLGKTALRTEEAVAVAVAAVHPQAVPAVQEL